MKRTGIKTATSDTVIDTIVKPISREPLSEASITSSPISMRRTMFSSMTTASSTTKPTHKVSAINERLSRLKCNRYITANVPTIEVGKASVGIIVARIFLRNRKITMTTSAIAWVYAVSSGPSPVSPGPTSSSTTPAAKAWKPCG